MPGELGNPDEQQQIGYYERKYLPMGDFNDPGYGTWEPREKRVLDGKTFMAVMIGKNEVAKKCEHFRKDPEDARSK